MTSSTNYGLLRQIFKIIIPKYFDHALHSLHDRWFHTQRRHA